MYSITCPTFSSYSPRVIVSVSAPTSNPPTPSPNLQLRHLPHHPPPPLHPIINQRIITPHPRATTILMVVYSLTPRRNRRLHLFPKLILQHPNPPSLKRRPLTPHLPRPQHRAHPLHLHPRRHRQHRPPRPLRHRPPRPQRRQRHTPRPRRKHLPRRQRQLHSPRPSSTHIETPAVIGQMLPHTPPSPRIGP